MTARPESSLRRARFAVPPPAGSTGTDERLRLVDPTGSAVAWLGYGETVIVLGFFVREDDGSWREVLRDCRVEAGFPDAAWTLIERDPTMARLRAESGDAFGAGTPELVAAIADGVLTIAGNDAGLLVAGDAPERP
ncbi:MAG: hypothetical protein QM753_10940 [Thermomicrobiales bacterium]